MEFNSELERSNPNKFDVEVRTLARKLGRIKRGKLCEYATEWGTGKDQEILSFAKPGRGRRAPRPRNT
jgi:hypothetical protein